MKKDIKSKLILAVSLGLVTMILVSSIYLQFRTVKKSTEADIEKLRATELQTQISTYNTKYEESRKKYEDNQNKIMEYATAIKENNSTTSLLEKEYEETKLLLGLTDVRGEGVIVTLENTLDNTYSSSDIRTLINELKFAGAEAISINDNRIINLTDIVTLNYSFIVMYGGRVRITAPYIVKAIGNKEDLYSTLKAKSTGYADLMESSSLKITVEAKDKITINKYDETIDSTYMKEDE